MSLTRRAVLGLGATLAGGLALGLSPAVGLEEVAPTVTTPWVDIPPGQWVRLSRWVIGGKPPMEMEVWVDGQKVRSFPFVNGKTPLFRMQEVQP